MSRVILLFVIGLLALAAVLWWFGSSKSQPGLSEGEVLAPPDEASEPERQLPPLEDSDVDPPEQPKPGDAAETIVRIAVRDADDQPVSEATVELSFSSQSLETGADGVARFTGDWEAGRVSALAPDGRFGFVATGSERPADPVVVVVRDAFLRGVVRPPEGGQLPASVQVAAVAADGQVTADRLASAVANAPHENDAELSVTTTDASGRFVLGPLDPQRRYEVHAAAPGYLLDRERGDPGRDLQPGGERLDLVVSPIYVLNLSFVGPGGEPVPTSPYLWSSGAHGIADFAEGVRSVSFREKSILLLGQPAWVPPERWNRTDRVLEFFTSAEDAERAGPAQVKLSLPGYAPEEKELWAPRARGDDPQLQAVELTPVVDGFGEVEVVFKTESGLSFEGFSPGGNFYLSPSGWKLPNGMPRIELWQGLGRQTVVTGVPAGRYQVSINDYGAIAIPTVRPSSLEVQAGQRSVLQVEVGPLGGVRFDVRTASGSPYEGELYVLLIREKTPVGPAFIEMPVHLVFEGPPYQLNTLPPGKYRYHAGRTRQEGHQASAATESFEVSEGMVTDVLIGAPDR